MPPLTPAPRRNNPDSHGHLARFRPAPGSARQFRPHRRIPCAQRPVLSSDKRVIGRHELWVEAAPVSPLAPPRAGRPSARERVKSFEKF